MEQAYLKYRRNSQILLYSLFLLVVQNNAFSQYKLIIQQLDKDSNIQSGSYAIKTIASLQTTFDSKTNCAEYLSSLPSLLANKGFSSASIDSVSLGLSSAKITLYLGQHFQWVEISKGNAEQRLLESSGWNEKIFNNKRIDFSQVYSQEYRMQNVLDNTGYPFAVIGLDSIRIRHEVNEEMVLARWNVNLGPLYHIDSIRVYGKIKLRNIFLQKYLGILNGSVFNKRQLNDVSRRLLELPFLREQQHWDVSMLGTGAVLNLYLQSRRSSQVNFLIGLLPRNDLSKKTQITGDVNLNLKNQLAAGESILINWQQLQPLSPKLNLAYEQPYIFNSALGIEFTFALFKRDTTLLQVDGQFGIQYLLSSTQSGKIFFQNQRTYILGGGIDTNQIKLSKKLPPNIDVNSSNLGLGYDLVKTNYRNNPRRGIELSLVTSVGTKKISRNNDIINLKDLSNPTFSFNSLYDTLKLNGYQLRFKFHLAHYAPIGKRSTLKNALNGGLFESQNIFRNELFPIGGYKLLRGFNEESIYASQYAVLTEEFRYLVGINSYLFLFSDIAATRTHFQSIDFQNFFISGGVGLAFETKFGLLNFSYAAGKRNDVKFDIREASKIHFGYVNFF